MDFVFEKVKEEKDYENLIEEMSFKNNEEKEKYKQNIQLFFKFQKYLQDCQCNLIRIQQNIQTSFMEDVNNEDDVFEQTNKVIDLLDKYNDFSNKQSHINKLTDSMHEQIEKSGKNKKICKIQIYLNYHIAYFLNYNENMNDLLHEFINMFC